MISVRLAGRVPVCSENFNIVILSDIINVIKRLTLHDASTHWALPFHTTFSDLDCIDYIK